MDFLELARGRYSVRAYQDKQVEEEKLQRILEAGRLAPTGANNQPQRILVVRDEAGKEKLSRATNLYGAPLALLVCSHKGESWTRPFDKKNIADIDATIVTDHMMLEATALGLGSVWICYFKPEVIREAFALPDGWEPVNLLAIGYSADTAPEKKRKDLSQTVFYETF